MLGDKQWTHFAPIATKADRDILAERETPEGLMPR